jgi:hypothetical protein
MQAIIGIDPDAMTTLRRANGAATLSGPGNR